MSEALFLDISKFTQRGGWCVDQQFMDLMGASYLLAHGMGKPVAPAKAVGYVMKDGHYSVYAYTYNWTSPWSAEPGPGKFKLAVNGMELPSVLGEQGRGWEWQCAGTIELKAGPVAVELRDLTGFDGRCAAICFMDSPTAGTFDEGAPLERPEERLNAQKPVPAGVFDFVVCGGGIAGMCAALAAARNGSRVALINDRPILGGNNSSEIRVHLGGRIESGPYPELGNLQKEFGPRQGGNAKPASQYEDGLKAAVIAAEPTITLFPNLRVIKADMAEGHIAAVVARHIIDGTDVRFEAPLFADCTGDGTLGALAGADFAMGREAKAAFNEPRAPEQADAMTMGASVQWYSKDEGKATSFPLFDYGMAFSEESCEKVPMGEWTWETGMNFHQIKDFERIRDYGLLVVYANWSYLKHHADQPGFETFRNRSLDWVAYVSGKRESRRLLGDYILNENDLLDCRVYPDGTAATTWTVDLHYPDPANTVHFPRREFKSIAKHVAIYPYPVPYRCLYSRNVPNLFMAGRNISVTHVALGTTRVMRTTGMLGEVVGLAADLCRRKHALPRGIYTTYFEDLKRLMTLGAGHRGLPNNQRYNEGGTLKK